MTYLRKISFIPISNHTAAAYRARLELGIADTYLHGPALPAQRRRVRVGADPGRRHRGRGRVAGDHAHRRRHRAAAQGRATRVGGDPRRADRAAEPHRSSTASLASSRRQPPGTSRCCSSTSTTSRPSTTASGTASATRSDGDVRAPARRGGRIPSWPLGGDEFIVVLRHRRVPMEDRRGGAGRGARPLEVEGAELFVRASIGSPSPTAGRHPPNCSAMPMPPCTRKARGRDRVEAFAPGTHETTVLAPANGERTSPGPGTRRDRSLISSRSWS